MAATRGHPLRTPLPVVGEVERIDQRDVVFAKGIKGRLGPVMKRRVRQPFPDAMHRMLFPGPARPENSPHWHLYDAVDGPVNPHRTELGTAAQAAAHVKEVARWMGADLVGICAMSSDFVYTNRGNVMDYPKGVLGDEISAPLPYAISIAQASRHEYLKVSPSYVENSETGLKYLTLSLTAVMLAAWLREQGYAARAHIFINEEVLHQPIAILAGIGELGRNDSLISAEHGPGMRLATVTTDLEMTLDAPISIGVREFCAQCNKCADNCPARAIPFGPPRESRGILKWNLNGERCYTFWNSNPQGWSSCANCIKSCPYLKPWTWWHRAALSAAKRSAAARRALLWLDDVLYGERPMYGATTLGHTYPRPADQPPMAPQGATRPAPRTATRDLLRDQRLPRLVGALRRLAARRDESA